METIWEGEDSRVSGNLYDGSNVTATGINWNDGMETFVHTGTISGTSHTITMPTASNILAAMPDARVGMAFYVKVGVYASNSTSVTVTVSPNTGVTIRGSNTVGGTSRNGCLNLLCLVTSVSSAAVTVFCPQ